MQGFMTRRRFSQALAILGAAAAAPLTVFARNKEAFQAKGTEAAMQALYGERSA
jgi:hypothetical protein